MLSKLLKHEFRATARVMGPMYLIVLVTALGGNLSTRVMVNSDNSIINLLGGVLTAAYVLAICAMYVLSLVVMVRRFRQNLLGDEGYIMFTLPANIHAHIWSKIIVSTVWFAATAVASIVSFLVLMFRVSYLSDFFELVQEAFRRITAYYALNGVAICLETLVVCCLVSAVICLSFYAALAVGHSFANRKMGISVLAFFVLQFLVQTVLGFAAVKIGYILPDVDFQGMTAVHIAMAMAVLAITIYGACFYAVTVVMLKKRLNLE